MADYTPPTPECKNNNELTEVNNHLKQMTTARQERETERDKQNDFHSRGGKEYEYGPDAFPPSPFIIWSRIRLADRRFNQIWGHRAEDESCKEWVVMSAETKKPWVTASKQLQDDWRGN